MIAAGGRNRRQIPDRSRPGSGPVGVSASLAVIATMAMALSACADDGPPLSEAGARGKDLAGDNGCLACHGRNGQGGVGPAWTGLAGATVELDDGTTVVADDNYLRRSISDPQAEQVAGYTVLMPTNKLAPGEVDAVIAYIKDLK